MKSHARSAKRRFETNAQSLSDATITRIRAAARQYVRSGGSIFPASLTDVDEHIGNVVMELEGTASDAFEQALKATTFAQPEDYGRVSNASDLVVSETSDAAFLFGAFVGLEVAGLTCLGQRPTVLPSTRKRGGR